MESPDDHPDGGHRPRRTAAIATKTLLRVADMSSSGSSSSDSGDDLGDGPIEETTAVAPDGTVITVTYRGVDPALAAGSKEWKKAKRLADNRASAARSRALARIKVGDLGKQLETLHAERTALARENEKLRALLAAHGLLDAAAAGACAGGSKARGGGGGDAGDSGGKASSSRAARKPSAPAHHRRRGAAASRHSEDGNAAGAVPRGNVGATAAAAAGMPPSPAGLDRVASSHSDSTLPAAPAPSTSSDSQASVASDGSPVSVASRLLPIDEDGYVTSPSPLDAVAAAGLSLPLPALRDTSMAAEMGLTGVFPVPTVASRGVSLGFGVGDLFSPTGAALPAMSPSAAAHTVTSGGPFAFLPRASSTGSLGIFSAACAAGTVSMFEQQQPAAAAAATGAGVAGTKRQRVTSEALSSSGDDDGELPGFELGPSAAFAAVDSAAVERTGDVAGVRIAKRPRLASPLHGLLFGVALALAVITMPDAGGVEPAVTHFRGRGRVLLSGDGPLNEAVSAGASATLMAPANHHPTVLESVCAASTAADDALLVLLFAALWPYALHLLLAVAPVVGMAAGWRKLAAAVTDTDGAGRSCASPATPAPQDVAALLPSKDADLCSEPRSPASIAPLNIAHGLRQLGEGLACLLDSGDAVSAKKTQ